MAAFYENTLRMNYFATNAIVRRNGNSMCVVSTFDPHMLVWKSVPDESCPAPDYAYDLNLVLENKKILISCIKIP